MTKPVICDKQKDSLNKKGIKRMNNFALLQAGGSSVSMIMLLGMVAVLYFLIIGPQRKQRKREEAMRSSLKKGDKITTIGGIRGEVSHIKENGDVVVKVDDNTKITFKKQAIGAVEGDAPATAAKAKKEKKETETSSIEAREKELEDKAKSAE